MDSGAFTEVARHGGYREGVAAYAEQVARWRRCGELVAAVSQDWMCEPFVVERTGKSVPEHQELTIERYDDLRALVTETYIMPVLQGYKPEEYASHVRSYGRRLGHGAWVGVGSVCKRNGDPDAITNVLLAIKGERHDLRLHGFGVKLTSLRDPRVRGLLHSSDSMAWSFAARREGRNANDWREAEDYCQEVDLAATGPIQMALLGGEAA